MRISVTISPRAKTVSRCTSTSGSTKNFSRGTSRTPLGPATRAVALNAVRAGAVSEGWTMKQVPPPPKMQWNWFSPSTAKQVPPPFLRQVKSAR